MRNTNWWYLSLLIAGLLSGCDDGDDAGRGAEGTYLVSATATHEVAPETMKVAAQFAGFGDFTSLVMYGVKTYTIVYQSTYQGESIKASGVLYIPQGITGKASLLSLQHGTTFVKADAPSTSGQFSGMEFFASAGYIAIMPDFIGYGESDAIFHPYYVEEYSASAVIDMIKAVKEFLTKEEIAFNDQLFLAGYSEGGYVTLAAAKEIETNATHQLTVTAVAAGAGGYDLPEMLKSITTNTYYAYPSYLAFVLMSYNNTFQWNKPLTYFFRDNYAAALSIYMNGQYGGSYINGKLTTDVTALLNPDFYQRLKTSAEPELEQALNDNSTSGWETQIPMRLYHGTKDEIIPYQNSEVTLERFKAAGSNDVTLTLIPEGTHGSSFVPMLQLFVPWFETIRND